MIGKGALLQADSGDDSVWKHELWGKFVLVIDDDPTFPLLMWSTGKIVEWRLGDFAAQIECGNFLIIEPGEP